MSLSPCLLVLIVNQFLAQPLRATQVVGIAPRTGEQVLYPTHIVVQFDAPINPVTVTTNSFLVTGQTRGAYPGTFTFAANNTQVSFTPSTPFARSERVAIDVSSQIKDGAGGRIRPALSLFTISSEPNVAEFAQAVVSPAGQNPFAACSYDLNNDGNLDLITANSAILGGDSRTVSVMMGRGDGTFDPRTDFVADPGTGSGPYSVCVADVDGDRFGDLIVANRHIADAAGTVSVLRNNRTGGFNPPVLYPVGPRPVCVAAADMNGDGYADIVACHGGQTGPGTGLSLLLGDGAGGFAAPVPIDTGLAHSRLVLVDLDRDGDIDVAMSNSAANSVGVLLNDGTGSFAPLASYPVGELPRAVAAADVNNDGTPDLVVANQTSENITILTNLGTGTFADGIPLPVQGQPFGLVTGDFNGDGFIDIGTANYQSASVSLLLNRGIVGFDPHKEMNARASGPVDILDADLNNDGKPDLITANYAANSFSVFISSPRTIDGRVYLDLNLNCAQDGPGEFGVGGRFVRLTDGFGAERYTMTAPDGTYGFVAPAGSYTVRLVTNGTTTETCNSGLGIIHSVTVTAGLPVTDLNFGVKQTCAATVTSLSLISWPCPPSSPVPCTVTSATNSHGRHLCPCEPFQYAVTIHNSGTSPLLPGSIVHLQLGPDVLFCSFPSVISTANIVTGDPPTGGTPNPHPPCTPDCNTMVGQLVQWTLGNALPAGNTVTFFVNVQVANVPLNTILCATPSLIAYCNPGNTQLLVPGSPSCNTVFCSHDPNDLTVSPAGCGPLGYVPPGTPLTYRINFQNIGGNASARRVIVRDRIAPTLDLNTLEVLSVSHPLSSFEILPGQEVVWSFIGINLPDAAVDEMGSHGHVLYRIRPKSSAGEGATILNSAAIFFDLNEPVITVTTTNTIHTDLAPPSLVGCQDISTNSLVGGNGNRVSYSVSALDACDGSAPVNCDHPSGSLFPVGQTVVLCTAVDQFGNTTNCAFTVTVVSSCLQFNNELVSCRSPGAYTYSFSVTNRFAGPVNWLAFNDPPANVAVESSLILLDPPLASGEGANLSVTIYVTNAASAEMCFKLSAHNFNFVECCSVEKCIVTVPDSTPPLITCPTTLSVQCDADVPAPNPGNLIVTDNCDPAPHIMHVGDVASGACPKSIARTYRATDVSGNIATCTQTITVQDTLAPVLSNCTNILVALTSGQSAVVNFGVTATNTCSNAVTVTCTRLSVGTFPIGVTDVTCVATNSCGKTNTCTFTVTVTPPSSTAGLCSFTQGFYGNANGKFNGTPSLALQGNLLASGPLVIGKLGSRSLTIPVESALLLQQRLPGNGTPALLAIGDQTLSSTTPATAAKGKFASVLWGQVVALSLNTRLTPALLGVGLTPSFCTRGVLPGPDGRRGTLDDVLVSGDLQMFTIPTSVLAALPVPATVEGLLELANLGLADQLPAGPSLPDITAAVDAINRGFDECRVLVDCSTGAVIPDSFNDGFASRPTLGSGSGGGLAPANAGTVENIRTRVSNLSSSKEPGEPDHGDNAGGKSVWWRWVAPRSGPVLLKTDGSSFDTLLAVYTGTTLSSLIPQASNDDAPQSVFAELTFQAEAGTEYQIVVDGYAGSSGNIVLSLIIQPPHLCLPLVRTGDQIEVCVEGQLGRVYTVEASTDLTTWTPVTSLRNTTGTLRFTDASAPNASQRFYRVIEE